jgi:hypothetical protein
MKIVLDGTVITRKFVPGTIVRRKNDSQMYLVVSIDWNIAHIDDSKLILLNPENYHVSWHCNMDEVDQYFEVVGTAKKLFGNAR